MSVVRIEKYEEEFEKEEYEIYALVYEEATSAMHYLEKYKRPLVRTYATIDCRNQHLDKMEGRLTWLVSADSKDYGYNFKKIWNL